MAKLYYKPQKQLYVDNSMNGYYDYPVICGNCKTDLSQHDWEWYDFCPKCGFKIENTNKIIESMKKLK